jgi:hypothetical protein
MVGMMDAFFNFRKLASQNRNETGGCLRQNGYDPSRQQALCERIIAALLVVVTVDCKVALA